MGTLPDQSDEIETAGQKEHHCSKIRIRKGSGVDVTQGAAKHGDNLQGSFKEQRRNTTMQPNNIKGHIQLVEPVRMSLRKRFSEYDTTFGESIYHAIYCYCLRSLKK